jgi:hypothetical protein
MPHEEQPVTPSLITSGRLLKRPLIALVWVVPRRRAVKAACFRTVDKLGASPCLLGRGTFDRFSVAYVSRERYVCLTGKNLAGLVSRHKTLLFFGPRPPNGSGTAIAPQNFAFFAPRPPNGSGTAIAPQNFAFFRPPPSERIGDCIGPMLVFPRPPNIANPTHTRARDKRTQMSHDPHRTTNANGNLNI